MAEHTDLDSLVHDTILEHIIAEGYAPDVEEISRALTRSSPEVEQSLHRLAENHGLVLHPNSSKIWVIHPFSLWPTPFWVESQRGSWWGNCAWCSLGVAALLQEDTTISTCIGAHDESVKINIKNATVVESDLLVHFSIPVAQAWDNVIYYCGTVLVFRSEEQIDEWCERHRMNKGAVLSIRRTWELARVWYGKHLDANWRKWTAGEAQAIFTRLGLAGDFWRIPVTDERF